MSASRTFSVKSAEPTVIEPGSDGNVLGAALDALAEVSALLLVLDAAGGTVSLELPLLPHAVSATARPSNAASSAWIRFMPLLGWVRAVRAPPACGGVTHVPTPPPLTSREACRGC